MKDIHILAIAAGALLLASKKKPANVGKLYDTDGGRPGGRVDEYWEDQLLSPNMNLVGRKVALKKHLVDPKAAVDHFGLHGIEFGNWMTQEDRMDFLFATMVTLADMAQALNIPQGKMGLTQKLQIALGARGKGGKAAAFYHPAYYLINLTKTAGAGTFAHEFGHALDEHLFIRETGKKNGMTSGGRSTDRSTNPALYATNSPEYLFEKMFEALYYKDGKPTKFNRDQAGRTEYFRRREEVWARTFEHYVRIKFEEKGIVNKWASRPSPYQPPKDLVLAAEPWIKKIIRMAFN